MNRISSALTAIFCVAIFLGEAQSRPNQSATSQIEPPSTKRIPTIRPSSHFNPEADADVIRIALSEYNLDPIIDILPRRDIEQRRKIVDAYRTLFGENLDLKIHYRIGGIYGDAVRALILPMHQFLSYKIDRTENQILNIDENLLIDILAFQNNSQIHDISVDYYFSLDYDLVNDMERTGWGYISDLLGYLARGKRNETLYVDEPKATADAKKLFEAGENMIGTDEMVFIKILATKSYAQLRKTFAEYERNHGSSIEDVIESEFSGAIRDGLLAIVAATSSEKTAVYFAKRIKEDLDSWFSSYDELNFIIPTRADIDLGNIKEEYKKMYGLSLATHFMNNCMSCKKCKKNQLYQKLMILLIGPE